MSCGWLFLVLSIAGLAADDKAPAATPAVATADSERVQKLLQNPDDAALLGNYFNEALSLLYRLTMDEPEAAALRLAALEDLLGRLAPRTEAGRNLIANKKALLPECREHIEAARTPVAELQTKALASPDDLAPYRKLLFKLSDQIVATAYSRPEEAQKLLDAGLAVGEKLAATTRNEDVKKAATSPNAWTLQRTMIADGLRFAALVGKPADELVVRSWASGEPTTLADLRGRVVLICNFPVIAGEWTEVFAQMKAWQAQYEPRGLTMIGVASNNREQRWNDATQSLDGGRKPGEPKSPEFTPEVEHETLRKFVAFHGLKIRLATHDPRVRREYNLRSSGNPSVTIIDQQGQIRVIRQFPHFKQNAQDLDRALAELLPAAK